MKDQITGIIQVYLMIKFHTTKYNSVIAELTDDKFIIKEVQDALDLIGELGDHNCNRIIIRQNNFHEDFFRLKTKLAGDILQKFSNYNFKLAVTGDFAKYGSKSLIDFIRESNKGNLIFFLDNFDTAFTRLAK
jgi:hypothetical protein